MRNIDIIDIDNDKLGEILVFELDSIDTLKSRICRLLSIPPKFLYLPNKITIDSTLKNIKVLDIYALLKTKLSFFDAIIALYENNYFKDSDSFSNIKSFITVFILNNKELNIAHERELSEQNQAHYSENMYTIKILSKIYCDMFRSLYFLELKNVLYNKNFNDVLIDLKLNLTTNENIDITTSNICKNFENNNILFKIFRKKIDIDLVDILKDKNLKQTEINDEIQENNIKEEKCSEKFKNFDNEKGVPYTEFELEQIDFNIKLKVLNQKELSILSLFNFLNVNNYTVFATTNNYFKVLRDFIPLNSWTYYADVLKETLLLKINNNILIKKRLMLTQF